MRAMGETPKTLRVACRVLLSIYFSFSFLDANVITTLDKWYSAQLCEERYAPLVEICSLNPYHTVNYEEDFKFSSNRRATQKGLFFVTYRPVSKLQKKGLFTSPVDWWKI